MADQPQAERIYTALWRNVPGLEIRSAASPDGKQRMTIGGYGVVFNSLSDPLLGHREMVTRSCFNKSEGDGWPLVTALYEHQPGIVLGATASGTLRLKQDNFGMDYEVDLPQSRYDVYESIERRDISGSSVGFYTYQDEWRPGDGGFPVRHLVSCRLDHVSPTSKPAYGSSNVSLRSLASQFDADIDEVTRHALDNNLNIFFKRTDNVDKRDPMETRSAPLVTINMSRDGVEVSDGKQSENPAPEPVSEQQPEKVETPVTPPEQPKPEVPAPVAKSDPETAQEPVAEEPKQEPKPEPASQADRDYLELLMRRNRSWTTRPDDPINSGT